MCPFIFPTVARRFHFIAIMCIGVVWCGDALLITTCYLSLIIEDVGRDTNRHEYGMDLNYISLLENGLSMILA